MTMSERREPSLRREARERYLSAAAQGAPRPNGDPHPNGDPLPNPPPCRGRERTEQVVSERTAQVKGEQSEQTGTAAATAAEVVPSLTDRVRALYEGGVVPVREIAALAGVSDRTIYKYAARHGWRPRVTRLVRGVGGRFVPLADDGKPHAVGLKALDPDGAAQAAADCAQAGALADKAAAAVLTAAQQRAVRRRVEARVRTTERTFAALTAALRGLTAMRNTTTGPYAPRADALAERFQTIIYEEIIRRLETLRFD